VARIGGERALDDWQSVVRRAEFAEARSLVSNFVYCFLRWTVGWRRGLTTRGDGEEKIL